MNTRRRCVALLGTWLKLALIMAGAVLAVAPLRAQQFTTLVSFTNVWKYDLSGRELGTAWRTNTFNDSVWASGPGLLGSEDFLAPYLAHVPSGVGTRFPVPLSQVVTTYYFRTSFLTANNPNVTLFASNLVDDGCVIWLNGRLAGGVRMPPSFNATTLASSSAIEGELDVVTLTNHLRNGYNQLAVEVHQATPVSGDIVFGMRLMSLNPTPLAITNQPQNFTTMVGDSVTFHVGVSGGPVTYRWYKDGILLPSTSNVLTVANTQLANTGDYHVTCSNVLGIVTSTVARLNVFADLANPKALTAIADDGFGFDTVHVRFSEPLILSSPTSPISARNLTNYLITRFGTTNTLNITNALYAPAHGTLLQLDAADTNWVRFGEYVLTINNVADLQSNSIAPGTQLPILWNHVANLVEASQVWEYHNSTIFDPDIFLEDWIACDYQPGPWWSQGRAPFYGVFIPDSPCPILGTPLTQLGWQSDPMLFRTTFNYPAHWPTTSILRLRLSVDDGLVLYLNGTEVYRHNTADPVGTPVSTTSRASTIVSTPNCFTGIALTVTNFLPGTNCFAVALLQPAVSENDLYFVMDADSIRLLGPILPATPLPALQAAPVNADNLRLSWNSGGYILESSTNLTSGSLRYPYGPWTPVPQLANPYLWPLTNGETRFFRLRK